MMKYLLYIFSLISTVSVFGQDVTFVSDFELVEVKDGVFVNWQIDSGYTCQGVDVLRSVNGVDFEEIGHISGVCGSLTKPVSYSFLDEDPVSNRINYYQLKINGYGFTAVLSLFYLELPDRGILIYPNPVDQNAVTMKFDNPNQDDFYIQLISSDGNIVHQETTTNSEVTIASDDLKEGFYFVRLFDAEGNTAIVDKLIVH